MQSKADRGLSKLPTSTSQQPSIKSKLVNTSDKENNVHSPIPDESVTSEVEADKCRSPSKDCSLPLLRDSDLYRPSAAMHLWWADNEHLVRGASDTRDLRMLVPTAALLFKDLTDLEKKVTRLLYSSHSQC